MWETLLNNARLGLFQDSDFAGDLEDSKSTSGGTLCTFGSHTFVPISWMCKKQTAVSHSSTESEIISLDTGLRLDGLLALELWDLIVSVFRSVSQISDRTGRPVNDVKKHQKSQGKINVMKNIDSVLSNVQSSRQEALSYVFEDNEAVIKMIIKGRSPTMRHVSRTHRVALDWLFDRINLDPKIQIKYIDTKNQLTDVLTKGSFKRDEWNHLLCLFNISQVQFYSLLCCNGEAISTRFRRRTSHSKIATYDKSYCWDAVVRVVFNFSEPGEEIFRKSVIGEDRLGQSGKETVLLERFSSTDYSKLDSDRVWSSQEWKAEATTHDRSGQLDKTSWRMVQQVRPDHEEILLDGTAQSVRYGEPLRDRSGQLDNVNSQGAANSQNFIMGRDTKESELSVESRSFVDRVNDQVRKRQKRISNVAGEGEEHSIIWGNVHGCNDEFSDIHG